MESAVIQSQDALATLWQRAARTDDGTGRFPPGGVTNAQRAHRGRKRPPCSLREDNSQLANHRHAHLLPRTATHPADAHTHACMTAAAAASSSLPVAWLDRGRRQLSRGLPSAPSEAEAARASQNPCPTREKTHPGHRSHAFIMDGLFAIQGGELKCPPSCCCAMPKK